VSNATKRWQGIDEWLQVTRWTVIGVLDAITEVMILALSVAVIFPLRMAWPKKLQAIFCFALRLP
jgi:hypothetical protein